ncbi:hypothetical protein [Rhizobium sp. 768_B6_N1_8]
MAFKVTKDRLGFDVLEFTGVHAFLVAAVLFSLGVFIGAHLP